MSDTGERRALPDSPDLALFLAGVAKQLGGLLSVNANGRRSVGWPESPSQDCGEGLPQMPDARPWQTLQSDDEWRGAAKLVDYWLCQLSERDRELIFTLAAPVCPDAGKPFDFRDYKR